MQKSFRSLVLATAFSLTVVPGLLAEQTGCNPHPQITTPVAPTTLQVIAYTLISYLGL
jgi:hypothetical protein